MNSLNLSDPDLVIGGYGVLGLVACVFWWLIVWVRNAPVTPDPWGSEIGKLLADAPETCPHCSTPQPPTAWFCEHCGRAVGRYNNWMPYVYVFSQGEMLRSGTSEPQRNRPLIVMGYALLSLGWFLGGGIAVLAGVSTILGAAMLFMFFLFWFALIKNLRRPASRQA